MPAVQNKNVPKRTEITVVRGIAAILKWHSQLRDLSDEVGASGGVEDLRYLLEKPGVLDTLDQMVRLKKDIPWLLREFVGWVSRWKIVGRDPVLLFTKAASEEHLKTGPARLGGAMLLLEYRVCGLRSGLLATNDRSGRSTLIASVSERRRLLGDFTNKLLTDGAQIIMFTFKHLEDDHVLPGKTDLANSTWQVQTRSAASYLPLGPTLDATLASIGAATRKSIRRHRKRADAELGCQFIPSVEMSEAEFLKFNQICMYSVREEIARWRFRAIAQLRNGFLAGLVDENKSWISIVCARRHGTSTEILWQMNKNGYPHHSLVTVMRIYLIESEIRLGQQRLYVEGGTLTSLHHSFVKEKQHDMLVVRKSLKAAILLRLATYLMPGGNDLGNMLSSTKSQSTSDLKPSEGVNSVDVDAQ